MEVKMDQECLIKGNKTKTGKRSGFYFHSFPEQISKLHYRGLKFRECFAHLCTKSQLLFPRQI